MSRLSSEEAARLGTEEIGAFFSTNIQDGLASPIATRRQESHGLNVIEEEEEDPLWKRYLEQFKDPMIALLLGSAVVSMVMGQYDDAISITLAIIIVGSVAFYQEYKSDQSLQALKNIAPPR